VSDPLDFLSPAVLAALDARIDARVEKRFAERLRGEIESQSRWMTIPQAVEYSSFKKQHIYDMRSDGRLTRHGKHGHAIVDRHELDAQIDNSRGDRRL
jgi:hypothetical protein